jgi:SAM-dependent methyltransferase
LRRLSPEELTRLRDRTVGHYEANAEAFARGTEDHDVSQNVDALLRHIRGVAPYDILDVGCGPGRDLVTFQSLGHAPVGLDAAPSFVRMAQKRGSAEVWHQDLLQLDLPPERFDGVFANAVLFHVPSQELPRVLSELHATLRLGGVLFCSNPHGPDIERESGLRYGCHLTKATWDSFVIDAGFSPIDHYYRPLGRPRAEQPWLATVWRRD